MGMAADIHEQQPQKKVKSMEPVPKVGHSIWTFHWWRIYLVYYIGRYPRDMLMNMRANRGWWEVSIVVDDGNESEIGLVPPQ